MESQNKQKVQDQTCSFADSHDQPQNVHEDINETVMSIAQPQNLSSVQILEQELKQIEKVNEELENELRVLTKEHTYDMCEIFHNKGRKAEMQKQIAWLDEIIKEHDIQ